MKKTALFILTISFGFVMNAQITVEDYEKEIKWDVEKITELEAVQASSTCGDVKVETKDTMFSGGCIGTLVRTYIFTDDCGNKAEAEQYINLKDDKAPTLLNVPKDMTSSKDNLPKAPSVTAMDNVGDDDVKVLYEEIKDEQKITRTWTAVDRCGNAAVKKQIITIEDI